MEELHSVLDFIISNKDTIALYFMCGAAQKTGSLLIELMKSKVKK